MSDAIQGKAALIIIMLILKYRYINKVFEACIMKGRVKGHKKPPPYDDICISRPGVCRAWEWGISSHYIWTFLRTVMLSILRTWQCWPPAAAVCTHLCWGNIVKQNFVSSVTLASSTIFFFFNSYLVTYRYKLSKPIIISFKSFLSPLDYTYGIKWKCEDSFTLLFCSSLPASVHSHFMDRFPQMKITKLTQIFRLQGSICK